MLSAMWISGLEKNRTEKSRVTFLSVISGFRAPSHVSVGPSCVKTQFSPQLHQQNPFILLVLVLFFF